jgi:hypothetical protein
VGSHVVYWKQLYVRDICLGGGHMMKENSYNYRGDKKTQDCCKYICGLVGDWVCLVEGHKQSIDEKMELIL